MLWGPPMCRISWQSCTEPKCLERQVDQATCILSCYKKHNWPTHLTSHLTNMLWSSCVQNNCTHVCWLSKHMPALKSTHTHMQTARVMECSSSGRQGRPISGSFRVTWPLSADGSPEPDPSPSSPWWTHQILTLLQRPVIAPRCMTDSRKNLSKRVHISTTGTPPRICLSNCFHTFCLLSWQENLII